MSPVGSAVPCAKCGCLGNSTCGHAPFDATKCCTLDAAEICPCCRQMDTWELCDKPEDRMYHAEGGTWWRREGERWVAADPPKGWVKVEGER